MLLSDLVYQTIKGCVWYNREISKDQLVNYETYQGDLDIGTFVNNIFVALNDAFMMAYTLNKVSPTIYKFKAENLIEIPVGDIVLNVYLEKPNQDYYNLAFTITRINELLILEDFDFHRYPLCVEVVKKIPYLEWSIFKTIGDFDLNEYGITDEVAYSCGDLAKAKLYYDIDANVSYLRENNALQRLNICPDFGNASFHSQRSVDTEYKI